jgi:hypothetical protein
MKNKKYFTAVLFLFAASTCFALSEAPKIKIVYPQGGEVFIKSQPYNITWDYSGNLSGNVSINLIYNFDGAKGSICNVGSASLSSKKFVFNTDTASSCQKILKDKEKYYVSLNYDNYYAPTSSYLSLSDKTLKPIEVRFYVDDICGPSNGGTFSSIPFSGLCNYGQVSEQVSIYDNSNVCSGSSAPSDGNWKWKCSGIKCGANDPNKELKSKLRATEIISLSGNSKDPESVNYWTEDACGTIKAAVGYDLVSCEVKNSDDVSRHGGSACATMNKVLIRKAMVCSQNYAPVCGKNGKNYLNDCFAKKDNVEINYSGMCIDKIDGICGSSNGKLFKEAPSINLCQSGTASGVSKYAPWTWSCGGINGGQISQCSADEIKPKPTTEAAISSASKPLAEMSRAELLNYLIKLLTALQANKK